MFVSASRRAALVLAPVAFLAVTGFLAWTYQTARTTHHDGLVPPLVPLVGIAALAAVGWLVRDRLEGWAFVATAVAIVALFTTLLLNLYPNVLVSSVAPRFDLTIAGAASHPLHPRGDELGGLDIHAVGTDLSGVDVLDLPQTSHQAGRPQRIGGSRRPPLTWPVTTAPPRCWAA